MTRKEAIEILEEMKMLDDNLYTYNPLYLEARDIALGALKAEPCEDAVSREAMLAGLVSIAKAKARSDAQKALMGRVMLFTEKLPPVTPKPRKNGKK